MKKRYWLISGVLTFVLCGIAFYAGYALPHPAAERPAVAEAPLADGVYTITGQGDYAVYENLQQMAAAPEVVVMGYFEWGRAESWNMSRDLEDPTKESQDLYVEGVLYDFHVLHVLKGELAEEQITVNFPYRKEIKGEITNAQINARGEIVQEATETDPYAFMVPYEYYVNPFLYNEDRFSVLFLSYNADFDLYFPVGVPYMATVDRTGQVRLRTDLIVPTDEKREEMAQKILENTPGDVIVRNPGAHWTDREDMTFYSEGGQEIRYIRSGPLVENYLEGMEIEEFLTDLGVSPAEQAAVQSTLDTVELPPHPHSEESKTAFLLQRWD